ncbi:winged helix-turn-helix transcriptional regulator [Mucilaginibacter gossypii]|nr:helix-turn-helix domain-containing protein [Mucilaginibacter gossypii]
MEIKGTLDLKKELSDISQCPASYVVAVNDTMNILSGKWKLPIIASLRFGKRRFKELGREIPKITPRMLSKELRDLEVNGLVRRTVYNTVPVTVEYELEESGKAFDKVLEVMIEWGLKHREFTLQREKPAEF